MKIAVVIPCYRVKDHILEVVRAIGPEVSSIYVVDDACPDGSGAFIREKSKDKRLKYIFHEENQGVGGAVVSGYKAAYADGADVVVKIDGDGQMDPVHIMSLVRPIAQGKVGYSKGNRFDNLDELVAMPKIRILGNAALSLMSKFSSGYWSVTDPTNGYTAISRTALERLRLEKISKSYFFESDVLFRLALASVPVRDVSIPAVYGDEKSNLRVMKVIPEFFFRHSVNFSKRILYKYYLREWSIPSMSIPASIILSALGVTQALSSLASAFESGTSISAGQITFVAMTMLSSLQLALASISYDVGAEPERWEP